MILILSILYIFLNVVSCTEDCYLSDRTSHYLTAVAIDDIGKLNQVLDTGSNVKAIFNKINLIRPVGSYNHGTVRRFIRDYLSLLKWNVEETEFSSNTRIGPKTFVNIIGTQNVTKSRRLVLACHYDSKQKDGFFGSTDSALPCSLMLSVAEILTPLLKKQEDLDISLELVFFDGEEAFVEWSATDSLYGSRYLANLWANVGEASPCPRLKTIDSLVLLDLLGGSSPRFYNFDKGNSRLYEALLRIETTISQQDIFCDTNHPYFSTHTVDSDVQDDHIPFMERGVPYVHLIPLPFPPQWHENTDDSSSIDWKSSKDIELILSVFVVQYFHLGKLLPQLQINELR